MQTLHPDLFPETLLVNLDHGNIFTSSILVAEHFKRRHDDVLKVINAVVKRTTDPEHLRNFAAMSGLDQRNRKRNFFNLTRDGFVFIAMGFTGPEADAWKWKFLDAFNAMESTLQAKTNRFAHALDVVRPSLRPVVDGTEAGLKRIAIAAPLGKSCAAVTYHRGQARRLGLLAA